LKRKEKRKRFLGAFMASVCAVTLIWSPQEKTENVSEVYGYDDSMVKVDYQKEDINEIPDKYNTGTYADMTVFDSEGLKIIAQNNKGERCSISLKGSLDPTTLYIDLSLAANQELTGEVVVSGYDFSNYFIRTQHEDKLTHNLIISFNNCKFGNVQNAFPDSSLLLKFYNCSFYNFKGSNAYFERCAFGGKPNDGLNPIRNVEVNSCYFSDFNYYSTAGDHVDGTQIYGYADILRDEDNNPILDENGKRQYINPLDTTNILFDNCRFEIPNIVYEKTPDVTPTTINACVMVQVQFSNGYNIRVKNSILNGGADTIFSRAVGDGTLTDIEFENIKIGAGRYHNVLHFDGVEPDTQFKNLSGVDSLYIGSVFKKDGKINLSITNDTGKERLLRIVTDRFTEQREIKAGPTAKTLNTEGYMTFDDMPFDQIISLDDDCKYVICYDVTDPNNVKQIRFVNYSGKDVYVSKYDIPKSDIILSGECGFNHNKNDDVTFTLSSDYVLTISGTGKMENYHSAYLPPWEDYKDFIKEVRIEDGVTTVGGFSLYYCFALEKVVLADSVKQILGKAFRNCIELKYINIADDVVVEDGAFEGAFTYLYHPYVEEGGDSSGDGKETDSGNVSHKDSKSDDKDTSDTLKSGLKAGDIIKDKKTGFVYKVIKVKKVSVLKLIKITKKRKKVTIKSKVKINGMKFKVTTIGKGAFKKNKKLKKLVIAKGIKKINKGAFKGCKKLKKVIVKNKKFTKKYLRKVGLKKKVKVSKKK